MTSTIKSRGIILISYDSGERDKVLQVLLQDHGKHTVIAKNCRGHRTTTPLPEPVDFGTFFLTPSRSSTILRLHKESSLSTLPALGTSFKHIVSCTFLCELTHLFTQEGNPDDGPVMPQLLAHVRLLTRSPDLRSTLRQTYVCATDLCNDLGFPLDSPSNAPSPKDMRLLVEHIATVAQRRPRTAQALEMLIRKAKQAESLDS